MRPFADVELNMFWTNLGWSDDDVIASYHAHGECEQYHSELKTDMDVERLPSGKFATNALVLELAMIAFNLLRMIGQESLKHRQPTKRKVRRRRLRTVIENLMLCASHFTKHARRLIMALGCSNTWRHAFWGVWQRGAHHEAVVRIGQRFRLRFAHAKGTHRHLGIYICVVLRGGAIQGWKGGVRRPAGEADAFAACDMPHGEHGQAGIGLLPLVV